jgi:hypothetical protein
LLARSSDAIGPSSAGTVAKNAAKGQGKAALSQRPAGRFASGKYPSGTQWPLLAHSYRIKKPTRSIELVCHFKALPDPKVRQCFSAAPDGRQAMQRTQRAGTVSEAGPKAKPLFCQTGAVRRLISRLLAAPLGVLTAGRDWHHWGYAGLREARAGPAGGLPPKRGWRTQIFKKIAVIHKKNALFIILFLFLVFNLFLAAL